MCKEKNQGLTYFRYLDDKERFSMSLLYQGHVALNNPHRIGN